MFMQSGRAVAFFTFFFIISSLPTLATAKVAVLNIQEVLFKSRAGIAARNKVEKKMEELKASLEREKKQLIQLQDEMKKKASV
ncbi:MAG: OmpH family outer membrane protein, partial [Candidatus Electrothrix sp. AR3]|nr:OmpH family outer membrane protein [Candidatus Electrothrix sp. AR3]